MYATISIGISSQIEWPKFRKAILWGVPSRLFFLKDPTLKIPPHPTPPTKKLPTKTSDNQEGWSEMKNCLKPELLRWSYYMRKTNSADAFHQESISFGITQAMAQYAWHCCSGILMKPCTGWVNTKFNRITFDVILQCDFQDAQYSIIWHYKV